MTKKEYVTAAIELFPMEIDVIRTSDKYTPDIYDDGFTDGDMLNS